MGESWRHSSVEGGGSAVLPKNPRGTVVIIVRIFYYYKFIMNILLNIINTLCVHFYDNVYYNIINNINKRTYRKNLYCIKESFSEIFLRLFIAKFL